MKDVNKCRYHLVLGKSDWEPSRFDESQIGNVQSPEQSSDQSPKKQWVYDPNREGIRLLADVLTFEQRGSQARSLVPGNRRDSASDAYGHRYWIDHTGTHIRVRWAEAQNAETLFPFPAVDCSPSSISVFHSAKSPTVNKPEPLSGLAVLTDGYLVTGSPTTNSLLAFDLYSLDGGFLRIALPTIAYSQIVRPFDLAACADGGLLVLDKENKLVVRLNRQLSVQSSSSDRRGEANVPLLFQPQTGEIRKQKSDSVADSIALEMRGIPVAIASLPDGGFWLLEHADNMLASTLWHYPPSATSASSATALPLRTENLIDSEEAALDIEQIVGYDLAYVPCDRTEKSTADGTLFVTDIQGNQAYALRVETISPLLLRIEKRYYPLRSLEPVSLIAPRVDALCSKQLSESNSSQKTVHYLQANDRWLPIKPLPRHRYWPEATLVLNAFDGHEPSCLWHRLCLDACLPPGTELKIEARAADQESLLTRTSWQPQPDPYKRSGVEVPYSALWSEEELKEDCVGTWELLFQQVRGQYMQIKLTLVGNRRSTPLVRSLRAHYPRFSYLQAYLPDVYQQDPVSSSFLDRFLANPEGIFTTIEGLIAQVQTHFDVRTVAPEAVTWLASWIGLALEESWSDYQRRLLIAQAPYFFQRRGTQAGLLQAILLAVYPELGPRIFRDDAAQLCSTVRIVERFLARTYDSVAVGDPTDSDNSDSSELSASERTSREQTSEDSRAHRFTVLIPTTLDDDTQRLIERIVELEKPVHTTFAVKQYWAMFRVGEIRLGIDTVLGRGGQFETFELGKSALAEATLGAAFPYDLAHRTVLSR